MRSGFCFNGNKLNNLLISTSSTFAETDGWYCESNTFDTADYAVGFRFQVSDLYVDEQTLIQTVDTTNGDVGMSFTLIDNKLTFLNVDNYEELFTITKINNWYFFYAHVMEESMTVYLYDCSDGTLLTDNLNISVFYPSNSKMVVMNNGLANAPLVGSICDLIFDSGGDDDFWLFRDGGYRMTLYTMCCPMREGSGVVCRGVANTNLFLQTGGTYTAPAWVTLEGVHTGRRWQ